MKKGLIIAFTLLACVAFAQDSMTARPMFLAVPPHSYGPVTHNPAAAQLPQWTFSWTSSFDHRNFTSTIVGTDPSKNNTTTTIRWGIIPLKMVYGPNNGNKTFDPGAIYFGNLSATQMINTSPEFQSSIDYVQDGIDLGTTQYNDAYERGNFWGSVSTNTAYHLLFAKAVIAPTQTINVSASQGNVISNPWSGIPTGTMDFGAFDAQLQTIMRRFTQINPGVLPLFLTYNVYLTSGGCCIGGYHSANSGQPGGQTYAYTTTISQASFPVFSQDISALTHEIGEWTLDPFIDNASPCPNNSILENGDPLENNATFGDYPYTVNGHTYHPQDLVFMSWFGAPPATSLPGFVTFQGEKLAVCQIN